MFVDDGEKVICTDCGVTAKRLKEWEAKRHRDDPEWYWEPYYEYENHLWVCPKCLAKDFITE